MAIIIFLSLYEVLKVHLDFKCLTGYFHALSIRCQNLFSDSGDEGIRTPDPLLARQVLSQLSYTPIGFYGLFSQWA